MLAYVAVFLLLFHINVLNNNTLKLAKRIEQKREVKLQRVAGTFTFKSSDPEAQYVIKHFRSRSENELHADEDDYCIVNN